MEILKRIKSFFSRYRLIKHRGEAYAITLITIVVIAVILLAFAPMLNPMSTSRAVNWLTARSYIVAAPGEGYAGNFSPSIDNYYDLGSEAYSWANSYLSNIFLSGTSPIVLTGSAKSWIEFRPELDFDIIKKNTVPVSYTRGIFTGFELPIWNADNQELIFEICVPDRWDGESIIYVHMDVFLIEAQDEGDAFKLQIAYEHYSTGIDVVPATSTSIPIETETGASAAFQSYYIHFDVPTAGIQGDDILAFRLRRIAVTEGIEITNNVVFNHAGVVFLCDKFGNPIYD